MTHHCENGRATLATIQPTLDGGALYQSWQVCGCFTAGLRDALGPPCREIMATAEQVNATGNAVMAMPGGIHWERPE